VLLGGKTLKLPLSQWSGGDAQGGADREVAKSREESGQTEKKITGNFTSKQFSLRRKATRERLVKSKGRNKFEWTIGLPSFLAGLLPGRSAS